MFTFISDSQQKQLMQLCRESFCWVLNANQTLSFTWHEPEKCVIALACHCVTFHAKKQRRRWERGKEGRKQCGGLINSSAPISDCICDISATATVCTPYPYISYANGGNFTWMADRLPEMRMGKKAKMKNGGRDWDVEASQPWNDLICVMRSWLW